MVKAKERAGDSKEATTVFDLRTEAEMRLHSEKTARELALRKRREESGERDVVAEPGAAGAAAPAEEERAA